MLRIALLLSVVTLATGCSKSSCFFACGSGADDVGSQLDGSIQAHNCAPQATPDTTTAGGTCEPINGVPGPHCGTGAECCCFSGQTCAPGIPNPTPDNCGFCYNTNDTRFTIFCGPGAHNTPNYCPANTTCIRQTSVANAAVWYGCCPAGQSCDGVEGFGACVATDAGM